MMAMTAAEWAKYQSSLPPENRISYAEYLASINETPATGVSTPSAAPVQVPNFTPYITPAAATGPFVGPIPVGTTRTSTGYTASTVAPTSGPVPSSFVPYVKLVPVSTTGPLVGPIPV